MNSNLLFSLWRLVQEVPVVLTLRKLVFVKFQPKVNVKGPGVPQRLISACRLLTRKQFVPAESVMRLPVTTGRSSLGAVWKPPAQRRLSVSVKKNIGLTQAPTLCADLRVPSVSTMTRRPKSGLGTRPSPRVHTAPACRFSG